MILFFSGCNPYLLLTSKRRFVLQSRSFLVVSTTWKSMYPMTDIFDGSTPSLRKKFKAAVFMTPSLRAVPAPGTPFTKSIFFPRTKWYMKFLILMYTGFNNLYANPRNPFFLVIMVLSSLYSYESDHCITAVSIPLLLAWLNKYLR